jgi:hypothetical protein
VDGLADDSAQLREGDSLIQREKVDRNGDHLAVSKLDVSKLYPFRKVQASSESRVIDTPFPDHATNLTRPEAGSSVL